MRIFCQNCGSPTEFAGARPNFCNSCGTNFATGKKAPPQKRAPIEQEQVIENNEDSDDENLSVPDMSKLDFDVQGSLKVAGTKMGDITSISDESQAMEHIPSQTHKGKRISKKKFLEQFKQEAGSLRKGS